ncbi:MAG: hypothetical protein Athens101426_293 [Parcubacteria group bacterium Athens1014_26]|nr:MAG: hypothetical protein Athens101426_293 [Parcubacteria group bacterium Athens1014_26]
MKISEVVKGELMALVQAALWGLAPIIIVLSYLSLTPVASLALSTFFAAIFFAIILTIKKKWKDFAVRGIFKDLFFAAFFIGILLYSFYFMALKFTSPGNASLIGLMEIFFSYLFFNVWKKEGFSPQHILGALMMVLGAAVVIYPKTHGLGGLNKGDVLVFVSVIFAPFGNYFQKRLMRKISSEAIMFGRSVITLPFVILLAYFMRETISVYQVQKAFWFLIMNGVVFLGVTKLLWLASIHRISVTKSAALSSVAPAFTLVYAYLFLGQIPTIWQIFAFIPFCAGLVLLTRKSDDRVLAMT